MRRRADGHSCSLAAVVYWMCHSHLWGWHLRASRLQLRLRSGPTPRVSRARNRRFKPSDKHLSAANCISLCIADGFHRFPATPVARPPTGRGSTAVAPDSSSASSSARIRIRERKRRAMRLPRAPTAASHDLDARTNLRRVMRPSTGLDRRVWHRLVEGTISRSRQAHRTARIHIRGGRSRSHKRPHIRHPPSLSVAEETAAESTGYCPATNRRTNIRRYPAPSHTPATPDGCGDLCTARSRPASVCICGPGKGLRRGFTKRPYLDATSS